MSQKAGEISEIEREHGSGRAQVREWGEVGGGEERGSAEGGGGGE